MHILERARGEPRRHMACTYTVVVKTVVVKTVVVKTVVVKTQEGKWQFFTSYTNKALGQLLLI
jgi:hypothetical protein